MQLSCAVVWAWLPESRLLLHTALSFPVEHASVYAGEYQSDSENLLPNRGGFTLVLGGYRADVSYTFLEASPYGRRVYLRHNRARLLNELNSSELIVKLRNPMPPMDERENRVGRKRWKTPLRRANRIQDVKKRTSSGKYDGQSTVTSS